MAVPTVQTIAFDKPSYSPGATITATITYAGTNVTPVGFTFTGTATDSVTGEKGSASGTFNVDKKNRLAASGADSEGRTWTVKSDDGVGQAVLTAVA